MRVLYVTTCHRTGGWLAEALAADSASQVVLHEEIGLAEGVARLREEVFDAVLMSHDPENLDALELVAALRAGGAEEPLIVLGVQDEQEMAALCYEVGADAYVSVNTATTRALLWTVARAIERHRLVAENQRFREAQRQRAEQEQHETERLLSHQRGLIDDLEKVCIEPCGSELDGAETDQAESQPPLPRRRRPLEAYMPPALLEHYRELLRAYVIMGSGNLSGEMSQLGQMLAEAGISADQALELHLEALEQLVLGLGNRSTRHVMSRADLLVLEVLAHLAEGYRRRYHQRQCPPQQRSLPGFEPPFSAANDDA